MIKIPCWWGCRKQVQTQERIFLDEYFRAKEWSNVLCAFLSRCNIYDQRQQSDYILSYRNIRSMRAGMILELFQPLVTQHLGQLLSQKEQSVDIDIYLHVSITTYMHIYSNIYTYVVTNMNYSVLYQKIPNCLVIGMEEIKYDLIIQKDMRSPLKIML